LQTASAAPFLKAGMMVACFQAGGTILTEKAGCTKGQAGEQGYILTV